MSEMLAAARIRGFSVEDGEGRCPGEAARRALGTALRRAGMDSDRMGDCRFLSLSGCATRSARAAVEQATATSRPKGRQPQKWQSWPPTMMTNLVSRWPSAQRRRTQGRIDVESRRKSFATRLSRTMIRHALPSSTVPAASLGVHGATPRSRLIASPGFPLSVAAGLLRAGSGAVDLASITDPTDKNLRAAADTQKHPARSFLDTCGSACPTR